MSHREMRRSGSDEGGSSPREVTQGPRRGRAFEHIPSTDSPESTERRMCWTTKTYAMAQSNGWRNAKTEY